MDRKERLNARSFESLEAMMLAYAEEAVRMAAESHGMMLDFSTESIGRLETVLAAQSPLKHGDLEWATKLWGGYFGEVFRQRYPADWVMASYPGGEMAMPALEIHGSQLYPLMKVQRRLTLGPGEDLVTFFGKVTKALDAGPRPS